MECKRQNFLRTVFCPFTPLPLASPMDPENQNFEKMKKPLEEIIILKTFTINDSHMTYLPNNPKNQNFEKMEKTPGDITILHCVPKIMIR